MEENTIYLGPPSCFFLRFEWHKQESTFCTVDLFIVNAHRAATSLRVSPTDVQQSA